MSRKSKSPVIDWNNYLQAKIISPQEKSRLEQLNSSNDEKRLTLVNNKLLLKVHDYQAAKFLLDLTLFLFSRSKQFLVSYCSKGVNCYESLLENLKNEREDIVRLNYGLILRILFRVNPTKVRGQIKRLLETTYDNIRRHINNVNMILVLTQVVMNITKDRNNRKMFYTTGGLRIVVGVLQKYRSNIQIEYTCCFCVWTLSYLKKYQKAIFRGNAKVFAILHDILVKQKKEKVKRIILLAFQNFLECNEVLTILINIGVYPTLLTLKKKTFKDEDISAILDFMIEKLDVHIKEISSFSEYRQEVLLGKLDWTPTHKSERFWKENIKNFEDNNHFMIRKLISLLSIASKGPGKGGEGLKKTQVVLDEMEEDSIDEDLVLTKEERDRTLVISLFDLGEFIRFCPRAKKVIQKFGGKKLILNLMNHPNEKVRNQAILTTQKLLINKWDHMK